MSTVEKARRTVKTRMRGGAWSSDAYLNDELNTLIEVVRADERENAALLAYRACGWGANGEDIADEIRSGVRWELEERQSSTETEGIYLRLEDY